VQKRRRVRSPSICRDARPSVGRVCDATGSVSVCSFAEASSPLLDPPDVLRAILAPPRDESRGECAVTCQLADVFCGCGGASSGFRAAGFRPDVAFDKDPKAANVFEDNFPGVTVDRRVISHQDDDEAFSALLAERLCAVARARGEGYGSARAHWHVHFSPACQKVSCANRLASKADVASGLALTMWSIRTGRRFTHDWGATFSVEQVASHTVKRALEQARIPYLVVNASAYGTPQKRERAIVASPDVLRALTRLAQCRPCVARTYLPALAVGAMLQIGTTNTPDRISSKGFRPIRDEECLRDPNTQPAHTVTRKGSFVIEADRITGVKIRRPLSSIEKRRLQCLHALDMRSSQTLKALDGMVADAVPPPLAAALGTAVNDSLGRVGSQM